MARETELVVTGYGAYISKHQGRLQVRREGEVEADAPLMYLRRVVVGTRAASLSTVRSRPAVNTGSLCTCWMAWAAPTRHSTAWG